MSQETEPVSEKTIETDSTTTITSSQSQSEERRDLTLIEFDGSDDSADPRNWSKKYKWSILVILSGVTLTTNLTVLVCAPATPQILDEFHSSNQLSATLIISIWNLGGMFGSLLIGPLSELHGRQPVYNVANLLCLVTLVVQTQSRNIAMVITFRCLNGLFVAGTALNPSIVGDLFVVEERGRAQSLLSLMPLLGPVVGPIAGGWIAQRKGWRWTFWFAFFILAFFSCCFLLLYRETYEATILRRKALRLRSETGQPELHSAHDHTLSTTGILRKAFLRPLKIFFMPIFLFTVIPGCVVNTYVYVIATNISQVMESVYHFSEGAAGFSFLGIAGGMAISVLLCSRILDRYTNKMKAKHNGEIKPEWRLRPAIVGYLLIPTSLFWYGWTAEPRISYVVPILATALCGFATYLVTVPMVTYLVDVFGIHRASAMSAYMMTWNAISTVLPLAAPPLYSRLGLGWGNSILAFIALGLVPVPLLLLTYGERVRRWSAIEG